MVKACFTCGLPGHLAAQCPARASAQVQSVDRNEGEEDVFDVGSVRADYAVEKSGPMYVVSLESAARGMFPPAPNRGRTIVRNRFKVLQPTEEDDEESDVEEKNVRMVCDGASRESGESDSRGGCVRSVAQAVGHGDVGWCDLGKGDLVVDSAADESCWPVGHGDAFPTKPSSRKMRLRTANGEEMRHYGEKRVLFRCGGPGGGEPLALTFQVTDVRKPLLAVRRLTEKGNKVVLSGDGEESYVYNAENNLKIPIVKKGGSFVIEARFTKKLVEQTSGFARPA